MLSREECLQLVKELSIEELRYDDVAIRRRDYPVCSYVVVDITNDVLGANESIEIDGHRLPAS